MFAARALEQADKMKYIFVQPEMTAEAIVSPADEEAEHETTHVFTHYVNDEGSDDDEKHLL